MSIFFIIKMKLAKKDIKAAHILVNYNKQHLMLNGTQTFTVILKQFYILELHLVLCQNAFYNLYFINFHIIKI